MESQLKKKMHCSQKCEIAVFKLIRVLRIPTDITKATNRLTKRFSCVTVLQVKCRRRKLLTFSEVVNLTVSAAIRYACKVVMQYLWECFNFQCDSELQRGHSCLLNISERCCILRFPRVCPIVVTLQTRKTFSSSHLTMRSFSKRVFCHKSLKKSPKYRIHQIGYYCSFFLQFYLS